MTKKIGFTLFAAILFLLTTTAFSLAIPGMIEAEVYDNGGEGVGFHCTSGSPVTETNSDSPGNGMQLAYIDAGEWIAFTVNATAGFYNVEVRVARDPSAPAGGAFHIEFGGVDVTGIQVVPSTGGWTTFATMVVGPIEVTTGGSQIMKFYFDGGPFNFNWVNFVSTSESPSPSPSPTPAPTVSPNPAPVSALHVDGQFIKNDAGNNVTLRGVAIGDIDAIYKGDRKTDSTQTTPISVQEIIDKGSTSDWHIDIWRLPIHADVNDETGHHGWNVRNNPQWFFDNIIEPAVSKVISTGKYVIIDWHYVGVSWDDATVIAKTEEFWLGNGAWTGIAAHYANNPNVLFELFNEPGGGSWSSWKTRSSDWINRIRGAGANNIIIVGGPGWSQTLPQSAGDLISATNIVYACHIYPQHVGGTVPNWIEYTSSVAPVMMTEWGFENTGPAPVGGTAAAYGATFKAYINSKPNVSWVAWCFDYIYHSYMFDTNWTLLGNGQATASTLYFGASGVDKGVHGITAPADTAQNFMGQFTKDWLAEAATGSTQAPTADPTAAPTLAPTAVPTAVPTQAPTAVPTAVPTVAPTAVPTAVPTAAPTAAPTVAPTAVPTQAPTAVPTAVPTEAPTSVPTAVPTAGPTGVSGGLKAQYKVGDAATTSQSIKPYFNIVNTGTSAIDMTMIKIRYWYTKEGTASETANVYYCSLGGTSFVVPGFGTSYYEVGFAAGTPVLNAGANCEIQSGFNKTDWTNYDQPSDWGFNAAYTNYTDDANITLYQNGVLIWGSEPSGSTAVPTSVPTAAPTSVPTAVPTQAPTAVPTAVPTVAPTAVPTAVPTVAPTAVPTAPPSGCTTVTAQPANFGTVNAFCFQTQSAIAGWGASNCDGRTVSVTVNGTGTAITTVGAALPAKQPTDYYVFQWTAGIYSYASNYWW